MSESWTLGDEQERLMRKHAASITAFWHSLGFQIKAEVQSFYDMRTKHREFYVATDMVNGLPKGATEKDFPRIRRVMRLRKLGLRP